MRRSVGSRRSIGAALVLGLLAAVVCVAVIFPLVMLGVGVVRGVAAGGLDVAIHAAAIDSDSLALLLRTLRTAVLIGVLSTALAWPVAWTLRSRRRAWTGVMLAPMLLPSYLAYAGWGLLRSPGTWSGDLLASAPPPPWSSEPGYWPLLAGDVLAVAGLALWAWPLAAVILASAFSRLDTSALEALRLEAGSVWRKRMCVMGMVRGPAVAAVLAVALVMLGSAVPLHLAQMRTWAVHLWLTLDQTPVDQHWSAWLSAWPLLVVSALAGGAITSRLIGSPAAGQAASSQPGRAPHASVGVTFLGAAVWMLAVVGPGVLFAGFIPNMRAVQTFWHVHSEPFGMSLGLSCCLSLAGGLVAASVWLGLSGGRAARSMAGACTAVLLISGLVPGVLVGSAVSSAWNISWTHWMGDSELIVGLGHLARFGFVPAMIGALLAGSEPPEERDSRRLDGAEGLAGWARACLPAGVGTVAAAGLAVGLLSFQEIESAVILQPPGLDSFPRQMLAFLHYARTQELCIGALLTMAVGVLGAVLAVVSDAGAGIRWRG